MSKKFVVTFVVVSLALGAWKLAAQTVVPPGTPQTASTQTLTGPPADYSFPTGAGLLFFHVDPTKVADFELIIGRIHDALTQANTPTLKQQALNWKIYRSVEPVTDAKVYVFAFDPALTTASYDPLLLLAQVLPQEVQPLYERLKTDVIKIERMGLETIR